MVLGVEQEYRPVGYKAVEAFLPGKDGAVPEYMIPVETQNPLIIGAGGGEVPDQQGGFFFAAGVMQICAFGGQAAGKQVDMKIMEPREDQPPGDFDNLGAGPSEGFDIGPGAPG